MLKWWLAVGPPEHWKITFEQGSIWGLEDTPWHNARWKDLSEGDNVLFYATRPVGGVIGYGVVQRKFRQDKPLWPVEVQKGKVIWPNRFEIGVKYLLPQDKWETGKVAFEALELRARGGFRIIKEELANEVIKAFPIVRTTKDIIEEGVSPHEGIKMKLVEIGRLQEHIAEPEYDMDGAKLDVVWRRIERAVPAYVFEVQIGGDLYHAIGKLKHAFDLWNSNIFLVVAEGDLRKANELLSGTFHEIQNKVKLIDARKIDELLKRKKAYRDFEAELGIT
jgi:hypothetical protein